LALSENKMRYLTLGYRLIVLSPLLSFLLLVIVGMQTEMTALTLTASIIGVQICGMALYLIGYSKPSEPSENPPHLLLGGVFLVIWGALIAWYITSWHDFHIRYYLPEKPLTFLDEVNYAAYVLKGLLWVFAGLMLIITSISKKFRVYQT